MLFRSATPFVVSIPTQTIPFTLNVVEASTTASPPSFASIHGPGATGIGNGGSCTVGTPYTISMQANSTQGTPLRYGIDWDADGSVDQFAPSSGYVSSGTQQSASRTYATEGSKTVKVMAQDQNGLSSGWSTLTFTCVAAAQAVTTDDTSTADDGAGLGAERNRRGAARVHAAAFRDQALVIVFPAGAWQIEHALTFGEGFSDIRIRVNENVAVIECQDQFNLF